MKLNQLPKTTQRSKKRSGRGYGSGKGGHTVGRGAKGDKARGKTKLTFTGTKFKKSYIKQLPLRRGKGKFKSFKNKPVIVNLKYLNLFPKGSQVDLDSLIKKRIINQKEALKFGVKILGDGELKVSLQVKLPCSKTAIKKIEKAGGKLINNGEKLVYGSEKKSTKSSADSLIKTKRQKRLKKNE